MSRLVERLLRHRDSDRPALVADGGTLTYRGLFARAVARAAKLPHAPAGLPLVMANDEASVVDLLAGLMAGRPLHLLSPKEPAADLARRVERIVREDAPPPPGTAVIQATSGTTGRPKRVARTHDSLADELEACRGVFGYRAEDLLFSPSPFFHAYGLVDGLLCALDAGAALLLAEAAFTRRGFDRLAAHPVTLLVASPPFLRHLVRHAAERGNPFPALRMATSAGAPAGDHLAREVRARFGFALTNIYGMTEFGTLIVSPPGVDPLGGIAGRPLPGYEVKIFDVEGDAVLGVRKPGEEYAHFPGPVRASRVRDGFFLTGDIGRLEGGLVVIAGRSSEFINVGGEKVNPADVEAAARALPGCLDACAFAMPSPTWGERVGLYVQADPAASPREAKMRAALDASLPPHARPARIVVSPEPVPRTATGKTLRGALIEKYL